MICLPIAVKKMMKTGPREGQTKKKRRTRRKLTRNESAGEVMIRRQRRGRLKMRKPMPTCQSIQVRMEVKEEYCLSLKNQTRPRMIYLPIAVKRMTKTGPREGQTKKKRRVKRKRRKKPRRTKRSKIRRKENGTRGVTQVDQRMVVALRKVVALRQVLALSQVLARNKTKSSRKTSSAQRQKIE